MSISEIEAQAIFEINILPMREDVKENLFAITHLHLK